MIDLACLLSIRRHSGARQPAPGSGSHLICARLRRRRGRPVGRHDQLPAAAALRPDRDADGQGVEFESRAPGASSKGSYDFRTRGTGRSADTPVSRRFRAPGGRFLRRNLTTAILESFQTPSNSASYGQSNPHTVRTFSPGRDRPAANHSARYGLSRPLQHAKQGFGWEGEVEGADLHGRPPASRAISSRSRRACGSRATSRSAQSKPRRNDLRRG
jgi:hypothetical protein